MTSLYLNSTIHCGFSLNVKVEYYYLNLKVRGWETHRFSLYLTEEKRKDAERKDDTEDSGKIVFKKPTKRKSNATEKDLNSKAVDRKKSKTKSTMKSVKNKSLLSFDEEEDED